MLHATRHVTEYILHLYSPDVSIVLTRLSPFWAYNNIFLFHFVI